MNKIYDLSDRTLKFSKDIRQFVRLLYSYKAHLSDCDQLIRSSGSIGANYLEASESLGKKDFIMRMRISRKEAKESIYWLQLLESPNEPLELQRQSLIQEATELMKIFGSIVTKYS